MKKINVLIMLGIMFSVLAIPYVEAVRYYCGYGYFGAPGGGPPPNGSTSNIYTINPTVPTNQRYLAWTGPIMSYASGYWIQAGYCKIPELNYARKYYVEISDSTLPPTMYAYSGSGPSTGTTKSYSCQRSQGSSTWYGYAGPTFSKSKAMNPSAPIDYQSVVETSSTQINIANTHFTAIYVKYLTDWYEWDPDTVHLYGTGNPYTVNYISITEFTGSGGGS